MGEFGPVQSPLHVNALERKAGAGQKIRRAWHLPRPCFDLSASHLPEQPRATFGHLRIQPKATFGYLRPPWATSGYGFGSLKGHQFHNSNRNFSPVKFTYIYIYCNSLSRFHIYLRGLVGWEVIYITDMGTTSLLPHLLMPEATTTKKIGP